MAIAHIFSKHNARPVSRKTKTFALSTVLSVVGVGLFAVTASAISGAPLDASFDTDGKLTTDFGGYDFGYSVAIQTDGKIVVAGASDVNGNDDFAISRYNTDGTLDTSFDTDGKLTTDFGGTDNGNSVAIQTDGKIVVSGWSGSQNSNFALARYNTNGSLDTSFDTDGKLTTDFGGRDFGKSVAIQTDGKIVVAGWSEVSIVVDFALARYNTDGTLDTSFDTDGKLTTNFGSDTRGYSVAIQPDGRIVVAGDNNASSSYKFALARYNTDGTLDTSFDTDGKLTTDFGDNYNSDGVSVAIQPDGRIVVAGPSKANNVTDYGLARYNTDGTLDTSFDTDGKLTTDFGGSDEAGFSVAIQPDGGIVAAGYSAVDTYSFAIARYNAPPTVTLGAVTATSSSQTTTFTISGNQHIDCTTLSATNGVDFTFTNISAITAITQTSSAVCTITATSTAVANGVAVISRLQAANTFSITGINSYVQTTLMNAPQSVNVTVPDSTPPTTISQIGVDIDGAATEFLGYSVAMSADGARIAIGAPFNNDTGNSVGQVRVYTWNGTTWTQTGSDINGEAARDQSGYSIAMSADGTRVAIGAPGNDGNGSNAGHVRIYTLTNGAWTQTGSDINGEAANDESGSSVAMSADGTHIAIGGYHNDDSFNDAGHVRIYTLTNGAWTQAGSDINGEAANDMSGWSVAMSANGTRVAIGAPRNGGNGSNAGHVRIYTLTNGAWTQTGPDINGKTAQEASGQSVAVSADGTHIAIGGNGGSAGQTRVYALTNGAWIQTGSDMVGEASSDGSGYSVAMSADGARVAIGAPGNDGNGGNAGHTRVYSWVGTTWTQTGSDINGEAASDSSGSSVAMSADGARIAIGATNNGGYAGHVRAYGVPLTFGAPTISSVTAANGSLAVAFTSGTDGGSPITNYKYSVDGTNYIALYPATTTSPFTISGLTNGTTYTVSIKAVNGIGDSVASNSVTGTPVAPASVVVPTATVAPTTVAPAATTTTIATVNTADVKKVIATKSELPVTGRNSPPLIAFATILLSVGLVVVTRRRIIS